MSHPLARSMRTNRQQMRGIAKQRVSTAKVRRLREAGEPSDSDEYYELIDLVFHPIPQTADQLNYYEVNEKTCPKCVLRGRGYQYCCGWQHTTACRETWRRDRRLGYWTRRKKAGKGG